LKWEKATSIFAQGGCRVSLSGDIQDPPGHGAVQPALGDPQRSLPTPTMLGF